MNNYKSILKLGEPLEIYIMARWCYKIGEPIFENDKKFDKFEELLKKLNPDLPIFQTSWEDDEEPTNILKKYNINSVEIKKNRNTPRVNKYLSILLDNKSISIKPIRDYMMTYEWFKVHNNKLFIFSIKMDGNLVKLLLNLKTGRIEVASSRGRKTDNLYDYTDTVIQKYPKKFKKKILESTSSLELLPIYLEGFIDDDGITEMNRRYNQNFVNAKTAGLSALKNGIDNDLLPNLRIYAHGSYTGAERLSTSLMQLNQAGFETVPFIVEKFIDNGFEGFKVWISNIQKYLNNMAENMGIAYDGVVAQLDSWEEFNKCSFDDMYNSGNIALKFGENSSDIYKAKVEDIVLTFDGKTKDKYTTKIIIEPLKLKDNKILRKVNGYNLSYIKERGIKVGGEIEVLYQSDCDPILRN